MQLTRAVYMLLLVCIGVDIVVHEVKSELLSSTNVGAAADQLSSKLLPDLSTDIDGKLITSIGLA